MIKKGQVILFTTGEAWEGTSIKSLCEALKDFDVKAEWKAFESMRHHLIRQGTYTYTTDFWDSLIDAKYIKRISYVNIDIDETHNKRQLGVHSDYVLS